MKYAISCGHKLTAWAAEEALKAGGNALDAAVAAYAVSWVTEPCMSGPGGGGFALVHFDQKIRAIDFFCKTPGRKRPASDIEFVPITIDFGGTTDVFHVGHGSMAVPGAVDGLFTLHAMGARMPVPELLEPAILIAREGHILEPFQHYDLELLSEILGRAEQGRSLFFNGREIKSLGSVIAMSQLADFIDFLGREGRQAFYDGEIARRIEGMCAEYGGHIDLEDLAAYRSAVSEPAVTDIDQYRICTHGHPSVGGKLLLAILEKTVADLRQGKQMPVAMLDAIASVWTQRSRWHLPGSVLKEGGTTHFDVIDGEGNAVSLSTSIGEGSGCYIPGTEIQMNNMLGEMDLLPEGMHNWVPDMRVQTMMTPTLCVTHDGGDRIATGSGGSTRIPFMISQVLFYLINRGMSLQDAVRAPRVHLHNGIWQAEPGFRCPPEIPAEKWNVWRETNLFFGGVHSARKRGNVWTAAADARRYGVTAVNT